MSGSFVIWEETKIVKEIQAHNDCVMSLRACPEGFISGCAQGVVILWSANLQKVASYDVFAKSTSSPIGSIDMISHSNRYETTKILVRTESGDIISEISCVTVMIDSQRRRGRFGYAELVRLRRTGAPQHNEAVHLRWIATDN